mgnify:FL=1
MGNISNSTGDRYKDLIENIHGETKTLSKNELRKFINKGLWGKPFKELDGILEELINARVNKTLGVEDIMEKKPNKPKYKIEALVGRSFKLDNIINNGTTFYIESIVGTSVIVSWKDDTYNPHTSNYEVHEVLEYFDRGVWILEEL